MGRVGYKLIKLLGEEGKKVDIIPRTDEGIKGISCLTELWNKKGEYLGLLAFDKRVKWKRFVLIDLDKEMQMSKDCLIEAFKMTEDKGTFLGGVSTKPKEVSLSETSDTLLSKRIYTEENIREAVKRILDKRKRYLPTKEWVVNVEDIKEELGEKLI